MWGEGGLLGTLVLWPCWRDFLQWWAMVIRLLGLGYSFDALIMEEVGNLPLMAGTVRQERKWLWQAPTVLTEAGFMEPTVTFL